RPFPGEGRHGILATDLTQLPDGRTGEIVVRMPEHAAPGGGELVLLGRTSTPLLLPRRRPARPRLTGFDERVQMAPHTGGSQPQRGTDRGRGDRALLE